MSVFNLVSPYQPRGGQVEAIKQLSSNVPGKSTLIGVTGSGKTFTIANVIANQDKPVLVLAPNKTLAAQLYEEFSLFFPHNKVCYFVSYYDYYQPESYLPAQDMYIPKETKVNVEIERLRLEAVASLVNRQDTIVVSSVSCIYALGNPEEYKSATLPIKVGQNIKRNDFIGQLIEIQYKRNDVDKIHGTFQVMGNSVTIQLPYQKEVLRVEFYGNTIESLSWRDKQNNHLVLELDNTLIFPAKYFMINEVSKQRALESIKQELQEYEKTITNPVYKERIIQRVNHDLETIKETGYCAGIENYTKHFYESGTYKKPFTLLDFFPKDFLLVIDESHIAIPQLHGMFSGNVSRKNTLIEFGFRLPSAQENRPLQFAEIESYFNNVIFVSATPGVYELTHTDAVVEQIIRPTGLVDPKIEIHQRTGQMDHLIKKIKETAQKGFRSLVMVMTKKLAEEVALYLEEKLISVCYLHSELKTPERTELLQKLRAGTFDCLVGVNLLREGIDLPEVALVAIMDADCESFLRDKRSLIQIIGRAARNTESQVVLYADSVTKSMQAAIEETDRRRSIQETYNTKHGIIPKTAIRETPKTIISPTSKFKEEKEKKTKKGKQKETGISDHPELSIEEIKQKMFAAAENLDFETAIHLRELLKQRTNE
jgi:excinuclease ABC subunit B